MPILENNPPGTFCWVELATTDQNAAKSFYSALFGWTANDSPIGPNDIYTIFRIDGRDTAALYTMRQDEQEMGVPSHWNLYIAVPNADQWAEKAADLGGRVLAGPFDVMEAGRMGVVQDPTGAIFHIWQTIKHSGLGLAGVEGTLCWADLSTPDPAGAKQYYEKLFGWEIAAGENDSTGYLHIKNGQEFIGGIPPASLRPPNAPPHWMLYFYVDDVDASLAKAAALGAKTLMAPENVEKVGRMSIVADPQGAVFNLFGPIPQK